MSKNDTDKYIGRKLDGRYQIDRLIGVGGMSYVYRATDLNDNSTVAVKILKDEYAGVTDLVRRFRNESKAVRMLNHENIVKVLDVNYSDSVQYIVM
ncbi:MAG: protein kinase, partial [Oscillospiraceae bacterium]|nr:protein kinase [Oscillospiraceae bacterium]